jgi:aminopeptidase
MPDGGQTQGDKQETKVAVIHEVIQTGVGYSIQPNLRADSTLGLENLPRARDRENYDAVVSLDFAENLRSLAEVIVRVGLNLQPGQRLLIAEPYELQGVSRHAAALVEAVGCSARQAGAPAIEVIWGDEAQLRQFAERGDRRGFEQKVASNARQMSASMARGDALLFLESSHAGLMAGVPVSEVDALRTLAWIHFGPVAQQLVRGTTNWTVACAPTPAWADTVYADLPVGERLPQLWLDVFAACRVGEPDPPAAWRDRLAALLRQCDELNARRQPTLRFQGTGTDLRLALPKEHVWCTAELRNRAGRPFLANLPTEEIFTLPHKDSAEGTVRVARPVVHGGVIIDGIELEFRHGRVVKAKARTGDWTLHRLLETDEGSSRLGEVALVPQATAIARTGRFFHHPLLDENALPHVALGDAYPFTHRGGLTLSADQLDSAGFNRSLIHVDLPLDTHDAVWSA